MNAILTDMNHNTQFKYDVQPELRKGQDIMNYKNVKVDELEILIYFENANDEEKIFAKAKSFISFNGIKAYAECNTDGMIEIRFFALQLDESGAAEIVRIYFLAITYFKDLSINIGVYLNKFIDNYNLSY